MEKSFVEKILIILEILASICTITGASIWGIVTYVNCEKEKDEYSLEVLENKEATENAEKDSTEGMVEDAVEDLSIDTADNSTNIIYSSNVDVQDEKNMGMINVEDEVKKIRNDYNNIQRQKGDPRQHPVDKNTKVYYMEDKVVSIEVASGYNDIGYSRIYYFDDNNKLYFTFIFDKKKENRLYFKNDILIRYIDENGEIFNLYENLESCIWRELALCEGYELLESVN